MCVAFSLYNRNYIVVLTLQRPRPLRTGRPPSRLDTRRVLRRISWSPCPNTRRLCRRTTNVVTVQLGACSVSFPLRRHFVRRRLDLIRCTWQESSVGEPDPVLNPRSDPPYEALAFPKNHCDGTSQPQPQRCANLRRHFTVVVYFASSWRSPTPKGEPLPASACSTEQRLNDCSREPSFHRAAGS